MNNERNKLKVSILMDLGSTEEMECFEELFKAADSRVTPMMESVFSNVDNTYVYTMVAVIRKIGKAAMEELLLSESEESKSASKVLLKVLLTVEDFCTDYCKESSKKGAA